MACPYTVNPNSRHRQIRARRSDASATHKQRCSRQQQQQQQPLWSPRLHPLPTPAAGWGLRETQGRIVGFIRYLDRRLAKRSRRRRGKVEDAHRDTLSKIAGAERPRRSGLARLAGARAEQADREHD